MSSIRMAPAARRRSGPPRTENAGTLCCPPGQRTVPGSGRSLTRWLAAPPDPRWPIWPPRGLRPQSSDLEASLARRKPCPVSSREGLDCPGDVARSPAVCRSCRARAVRGPRAGHRCAEGRHGRQEGRGAAQQAVRAHGRVHLPLRAPGLRRAAVAKPDRGAGTGPLRALYRQGEIPGKRRQEPPPSALAKGIPEQPPQTLGFSLDRVDAELSSTASGDGKGRVDINVAVLDTGIQPNHPDLNVVGGTNCLDFGKAEGLRRPGGPRNLRGGTRRRPRQQDWARRGSHRAPGSSASGCSTRTGFGSDAEVICGIDWVTGTRLDGNPHNDIAVSNMSLGGFNGEERRRTLRSQRRRLRALRDLRLDQGGSHHGRGCRK